MTFREYFLGKKLSFVEMAIFALYGRGIPRVPSGSLPAERAILDFPSFYTTFLLSEFSKCIYNNSYCYYNKKLFHEKSQNFFEKSRGFFCLFFENFALIFVINNIKQNQNFFKNILIIFEKFCFYFVIKIRKNKFIYTFKKGAYYV